MLDGAPAHLLLEWMEYFDIEPFGEERADIRNAINCVAIANTFGLKKRGGGQIGIKDFMPTFTDKQTNPDNFKALMKQRYGNNSKSRR